MWLFRCRPPLLLSSILQARMPVALRRCNLSRIPGTQMAQTPTTKHAFWNWLNWVLPTLGVSRARTKTILATLPYSNPHYSPERSLHQSPKNIPQKSSEQASPVPKVVQSSAVSNQPVEGLHANPTDDGCASLNPCYVLRKLGMLPSLNRIRTGHYTIRSLLIYVLIILFLQTAFRVHARSSTRFKRKPRPVYRQRRSQKISTSPVPQPLPQATASTSLSRSPLPPLPGP